MNTTRLWVVRLGKEGEWEEESLREDRVRLGWDVEEDVSSLKSHQEFKEYFGERVDEGRLSIVSAQFQHFVNELSLDDLVISPLKRKPVIAVGRVVGPYYVGPQGEQLRPVKWIDKALPRDRLEQDLQRSMGSSQTLFEIRRSAAVHRMRSILRNGSDPGFDSEAWDLFIDRARLIYDPFRLDADENDYKREQGRLLAEARNRLMADVSGWAELAEKGLDINILYHRNRRKFCDWMEEAPELARSALRGLWEESDGELSEPLDNFFRQFPEAAISGSGTRMNLASILLMGLDSERNPPYAWTKYTTAYRLTAFDEPSAEASESEIYRHAMDFLDCFIDQASKRGLKLRHRLDAQSAMWVMLSKDALPPKPASRKSPSENGLPSQSDLKMLAEDLLIDHSWLQEVIQGLEDKGQIIFQGPPGTGKTFVALEIARWYKQQDGDYRIVQFHASYTYEDFVEGFRPVKTGEGQAGYELVAGPLKQLAEQARAHPSQPHILVIDEINRGNVAKILGELYFLLEYREEKVNLQYGGEPFSLPENLWLIGTMNTTDRSIALVDAALRRRFYFFGLYPDSPPIEGLLRRWLDKNREEAMWAADLVDLANRKLGDRHMSIGPSHFLKNDPPLDEGRVRFIWQQAVLPYIEEQLFGEESRIQEFSFNQLRRELEDGMANPAGNAEDELSRAGTEASDPDASS